MTEELKKIVSSLERARNSKDGTYLLITTNEEGDDVHIEYKGSIPLLTFSIMESVKMITEECTDEESKVILSILKSFITEEEKKLRCENGNEL